MTILATIYLLVMIPLGLVRILAFVGLFSPVVWIIYSHEFLKDGASVCASIVGWLLFIGLHFAFRWLEDAMHRFSMRSATFTEIERRADAIIDGKVMTAIVWLVTLSPLLLWLFWLLFH